MNTHQLLFIFQIYIDSNIALDSQATQTIRVEAYCLEHLEACMEGRHP